MKSTCISLIFALLISCADHDIPMVTLKSGKYSGSFFRTTPYGDHVVSSVEITFTDNRFDGTSRITTYPALCNGGYRIVGSTVNFTNDCPFPANFDWTFILNGEYKISQEDDAIIITREYSPDVIDTYRLRLLR
jgi:hypothetical protein